MKVVITGSSSGMGRAAAFKFILEGHEVIGIDIGPCPSLLEYSVHYTHIVADVADAAQLPEIEDVNILINNAGAQNSGRDIDINLKGVINCTRKYALNNPSIKSVLNQASVSAHIGTEFDEYVASKGGVLSYTRWTAKEIAKYKATCNSLSFGGVCTELNDPVMQDKELWKQIMDQTPMGKWADVDEAADWMYFMTAINKSCSGEDVLIDNLERFNNTFIWEDGPVAKP